MKLLSQKSAEYKGKEYKKHWVVIPNKVIEALGWRAGDELKVEIKTGKLIASKETGKKEEKYLEI